MTVQLPMASVDRFEALLQALEGARSRLGVASYGMSVTTLEEVFLPAPTIVETTRPIKIWSLHNATKKNGLMRSSPK